MIVIISDFNQSDFGKQLHAIAEDIQTEKMATPERIEANIATEQEIDEMMMKDYEFFNKYYR